MGKWTGMERAISQEAAEREPEQDRLDFTRRAPSPATAAALRRAAQPELLAADVAKMKQRRRPRGAS